MKNVIVSLAGECSISRDKLDKYDYVIGVDSGTEYQNWTTHPNNPMRVQDN